MSFDIEGLLRALGEGGLEAISREATDMSAELAMKDAFTGVGIDSSITITTDPDTGERYIVRGEFKVSLTEMKINFDGDIDSKRPPDLQKVFEVFSGDIDYDSDNFQEMNKTKIEQFEKSPGMADVNGVDTSTSEGKSTADDAGGNPVDDPSGNDIQERMNELQKRNKARFDKLQEKFDKLKEDANNGKKTWGEWTKDTIKDAAKLAAMGLGSYAFYEMVKEHQDAMNGCWLIETSTGNKCKITQLTCDADAGKAGTSCVPCTDCVTNQTTFNPCTGVKCKNMDDSSFPGSECKNCCNANDGTTTQKCLPDVPSCTDGCDPMCSSKYRNIPQGYSMKCVNVDWWGAVADGVGGLGGDVDSLLKKILQWLLIGLAIIVGIVILVYGGKFVIREISG
jgi:hypothetical protein